MSPPTIQANFFIFFPPISRAGHGFQWQAHNASPVLHSSEIGGKAKLSGNLIVLHFWRNGVNSIQLQAFVISFRVVTNMMLGNQALMVHHLLNMARKSGETVCQ
jgi:hypothetical protein